LSGGSINLRAASLTSSRTVFWFFTRHPRWLDDNLRSADTDTFSAEAHYETMRASDRAPPVMPFHTGFSCGMFFQGVLLGWRGSCCYCRHIDIVYKS
jgi:hypothetical protein